MCLQLNGVQSMLAGLDGGLRAISGILTKLQTEVSLIPFVLTTASCGVQQLCGSSTADAFV